MMGLFRSSPTITMCWVDSELLWLKWVGTQ
jgi:hypothetical protein